MVCTVHSATAVTYDIVYVTTGISLTCVCVRYCVRDDRDITGTGCLCYYLLFVRSVLVAHLPASTTLC